MTWERTVGALILLAAPALAVPAFFHEAAPFWLAGLPLLAGIWAGTPPARAGAMAGWLAVPAAVCAIGLVGIGHDPVLVWCGAAFIVVTLAFMASVFGISVVAFAVTLVPFFPASPLIVLADAMPRLGLAGLGIAALCFAAVETLSRGRTLLLLALVVLLAAWKVQSPPPGPSAWTAIPEPSGVTEHGRWRAVREILPEGGTAILGEAVFRAEDMAALDFWCRTAEAKDLTLFVGVTETWNMGDRGAVWQLGRETCAPGGRPGVAARAWLGIPGVTGGWLPMPVEEIGKGGPDFLICLEGFLPWSWVRVWTSGTTGGVVVVSNDSAFGTVPVDVMRRKASGAMAALVGRDVAHAETGRTVLVRAQGAREG